MKTIRLIILAMAGILSVSLLSCEEKVEREGEVRFSPVISVELPEQGQVNQTINFMVTHISANGCGQFERYETRTDGNTISVTFYAYYPDQMCTANIKSLETMCEFTPSQKGEYTFRFEGSGDYLERIITIN